MKVLPPLTNFLRSYPTTTNNNPIKFNIRYYPGPYLQSITLTPDYTTMTDPRTNLPYSEFVTTTFAYASKSFFLESFQAIKSQEAQTPENFDSLQEENRNLHDLGSAYTDQVDHLCRSLDILHVGLALAGEAFEFIQGMKKLTDNGDCTHIGIHVNLTPEIRVALDEVLKEIGDLFYYSQMLSNLYDLGIDLSDPNTWLDHPGAINETLFNSRIEQLVDYIKRVEVYKQDYNPCHMGDLVFSVVEALHSVCMFLGYPAEDVVNMNRAKLIKRYPSGSFSTQESAAKADAT